MTAPSINFNSPVASFRYHAKSLVELMRRFDSCGDLRCALSNIKPAYLLEQNHVRDFFEHLCGLSRCADSLGVHTPIELGGPRSSETDDGAAQADQVFKWLLTLPMWDGTAGIAFSAENGSISDPFGFAIRQPGGESHFGVRVIEPDVEDADTSLTASVAHGIQYIIAGENGLRLLAIGALEKWVIYLDSFVGENDVKPEGCPTTNILPVELRTRFEGPIVRGKRKSPLTDAQYAIVKALLDAGEEGLTKDDLDRQSGRPEARKSLKRLANSDDDWNSVIHFPGKGGTGIGYRIG